MLFQRILVALVGIPVLLFLIFSEALYHLPFLLFLLLFNLLAQNELYQMLCAKGFTQSKAYYLITSTVLVLSFYSGNIFVPTFLFLSLVVFYAIRFVFKEDYSAMLASLSFYTFGLLYVSFLCGHFYLLKSMDSGKYYFFIIVLFIWFNDSFAYFTGALFGKKKLPIRASPKKSYAGLFGGLLFAFLSLFLSEMIIRYRVSFSFQEKLFLAVLFGLIVFFADLIESGLKRSVRLKDSGNLLPGHGGILDRFDTWLVTIPLFYYFLKLTGKI